MDQKKEKRKIGRRTKYLDKDVPEEIGEERRSALQQIYEDNRLLDAVTPKIHLQASQSDSSWIICYWIGFATAPVQPLEP